jgi:hypothetical protein
MSLASLNLLPKIISKGNYYESYSIGEIDEKGKLCFSDL